MGELFLSTGKALRPGLAQEAPAKCYSRCNSSGRGGAPSGGCPACRRGARSPPAPGAAPPRPRPRAARLGAEPPGAGGRAACGHSPSQPPATSRGVRRDPALGGAPRPRLPRRRQSGRRPTQAYFSHPVTGVLALPPVTWAGPSLSLPRPFGKILQCS